MSSDSLQSQALPSSSSLSSSEDLSVGVGAPSLVAPSQLPSSLEFASPCHLTVEVLRSDKRRLGIADHCPICSHLVGLHRLEKQAAPSSIVQIGQGQGQGQGAMGSGNANFQSQLQSQSSVVGLLDVSNNTNSNRAEGPLGSAISGSQVQNAPRGLFWDYPKVQPLVKDIRWMKDAPHHGQTSRLFALKLEVRLVQYEEFKDTEWVKLLPSLMEDPDSALWVRDHIVHCRPPLKWSESMLRFGQQFDSADLDRLNRLKFSKCRMAVGESPLEYTTRFRHLCGLLNYHQGEHEPRSVQEMVDRATPELRKEFLFMRNLITRSGQQHEIDKLSSLEGVAATLISIGQALNSSSLGAGSGLIDRRDRDVSHHSSSSSLTIPKLSSPRWAGGLASLKKRRSREFERSGGSVQGGGSKNKSCVYHPSATSHSTEECSQYKKIRMSTSNSNPQNQNGFSRNGSGSMNPTSGQGFSPSSSSSFQYRKNDSITDNRICHHCNQPGHTKFYCPKLAQSKGSSNGGSNVSHSSNAYNQQKPFNGASRNGIAMGFNSSKGPGGLMTASLVVKNSSDRHRSRTIDPISHQSLDDEQDPDATDTDTLE
jgi:hypothetical protein